MSLEVDEGKEPIWSYCYHESEIRPWDKTPYTGSLRQRSILFAGLRNDCSGGVYIEEHYNFNGSGLDSFGGAKKWPHVTVRVALPEGRIDLRKELANRLAAEIDKFISDNNLEPNTE